MEYAPVVEGREFYMGGPAMLRRRLNVTPATEVREATERGCAWTSIRALLSSTSAIAAFAVADAVPPGIARGDSAPARASRSKS